MVRSREIPDLSEIPIPILNYINLIKERRPPYYDCIKYIVLEMEKHLERNGGSEIIYTINPRRLEKEISERIKSEKLTSMNIARTIQALFYGSRLEYGEEWFRSTSRRGRKNYHVKVNYSTIHTLKSFAGIL